MEAHRKTLVELVSSILFLAALFVPSFGLVTVEEINAGVSVLIVVAVVLTLIALVGPPLVWRIPNGSLANAA